MRGFHRVSEKRDVMFDEEKLMLWDYMRPYAFLLRCKVSEMKPPRFPTTLKKLHNYTRPLFLIPWFHTWLGSCDSQGSDAWLRGSIVLAGVCVGWMSLKLNSHVLSDCCC